MTGGAPLVVYWLLLPTLGIAGFVTLHHAILAIADRTDRTARWTALWALASFIFIGTRFYQKTHPDPATGAICVRIGIVAICALLYTLSKLLAEIVGTIKSPWPARVLFGLLGITVAVGTITTTLWPMPLVLRTDRSGATFYGVDNSPVFGLLALVAVLAVGTAIYTFRQNRIVAPELRRERIIFLIGLGTMFALAANDLLQMFEVYRFYLLSELMPMPVAIVMSILVARRQRVLRNHLEVRVAERTAELEGINARLENALESSIMSENHLRLLFDASPDAILLTHERQVLRGNHAATKLLGAVDGKRLGDLVFGVELQRLPVGEPQSHEFRRGDGSTGQAELLCQELMLDGRRSTLWILRDVTERQLMATQLQKAEQLAALGTLAASVAHEINNPLSYVHGNLSLLKQELAALPLTDAQRAEVALLTDDAIEGAVRVRDIVRDMQRFGRGGTDAIVPVDLISVLAKVEKLTRSDVRTRGRWSSEVIGGGVVRGNELRLVQILVNLVVNAAQALPAGESERHTVRVRVADLSATDEVELTVSDTGTGIPADQLPRIFDPFFSTKRGSGSGLGLSITRDLVRQLAGTITVQSEPQKGTTFRIVLPRADAVPQAVSDDRTDKTLQRRWRVLVIDDEPLIGRAITRMLAAHEVEVAHTAADGLARLGAEASWDAILCDALLGNESGKLLVDHLRTTCPHLLPNLVMMTGGSPHEVAGLGLPRDGLVLWKPFDEAKLRDSLIVLEGLREPKA